MMILYNSSITNIAHFTGSEWQGVPTKSSLLMKKKMERRKTKHRLKKLLIKESSLSS